LSFQIWTPNQGASGLIIIPKPTPILLVTGGRIETWTPQTTQPITPQSPSDGVDIHRTSGAILIVKNRPKRPRRIIGHPELATGASVRKDDTLYVSISEAVYRQQQGEEVELHFASTADDDNTLAYTKEQVWKQWNNDTLSDGWTRRRTMSPNDQAITQPKSIATANDTDLTSALERLRGLQAR